MKLRITLISAVILCLTACASDISQPSQSIDNMQAGKGTYAPAQNQAKVQVQVVKEYIPVAVPGQLMPMPSAVSAQGGKGTQEVFLNKEAAVKYANQQALQTPASQDFFNAMMTYDYMPDALYTIYSAPMKITDIVFQPGEKIISIAAGDTLRWQISQTYSGEGSQMAQHLLVKPNSGGLSNTVVVTTSRHVYHLILNSTSDETYMVSVSWHYSDSSNLVQFNSGQSPADLAASPVAANGGSPFQLDLADLDFNYKFGLIAGNKPAWYPDRIFNDGRQTFIEFPSTVLSSNAPLPMLFIADNNNKYGTMYNWRQKGRYMIIDTVIQNARLQTGVKDNEKTTVQIEYTGAKN